MKVILHKNEKPEDVEVRRQQRFLQKSPEDKMKELFYLIGLSMLLRKEKPIKKPMGLGLVIGK